MCSKTSKLSTMSNVAVGWGRAVPLTGSIGSGPYRCRLEHEQVHLASPDVVARVQEMFDQPALAAADLQQRRSRLQSLGRVEEPEVRLEVSEVVPLLKVVMARPAGLRLAATRALDRAGLVHMMERSGERVSSLAQVRHARVDTAAAGDRARTASVLHRSISSGAGPAPPTRAPGASDGPSLWSVADVRRRTDGSVLNLRDPGTLLASLWP